LSRRTKRV